MNYLSYLLLSPALFSDDLPYAKRLEVLKRYFSPVPGREVTLDAKDLSSFGIGRKVNALRGFVTIDPPKGTCFTVQRRDDEPDERVCKKQVLSFQLTDLSHAGQLSWFIKTGEEDFGTRLTWYSNYRMVLAIPSGKTPDQVERRFLQNCEFLRLQDGERRVYLSFIDGGQWVLKFPAADDLVPDQPEPESYLYGIELSDKKKDAVAAGTKTASSAENNPQATKKSSEDKDDHTSKPGDQSLNTSTSTDAGDDEDKWHIPKRGSFIMSADHFIPFGSVAPGSRSFCRYRYHGDDVDPKTPMVECQKADGFEQVIIPVSCLKAP